MPVGGVGRQRGRESRWRSRGEKGREKGKTVALQRVDRKREEKDERTGDHVASEGERVTQSWT